MLQLLLTLNDNMISSEICVLTFIYSVLICKLNLINYERSASDALDINMISLS
jgi:hypothetical protein